MAVSTARVSAGLQVGEKYLGAAWAGCAVRKGCRMLGVLWLRSRANMHRRHSQMAAKLVFLFVFFLLTDKNRWIECRDHRKGKLGLESERGVSAHCYLWLYIARRGRHGIHGERHGTRG